MRIGPSEVTPDQLFAEFVVVGPELGAHERGTGDHTESRDEVRDTGMTQCDAPRKRRLGGRFEGGVGVGHTAATAHCDANTVRPRSRGRGRLGS